MGLILYILICEMCFKNKTKGKSNVWDASYIWKIWEEIRKYNFNVEESIRFVPKNILVFIH